MVKVSSRLNIANLLGDQAQFKENSLRSELNPSQGYDLNQIKTHYQHRRQLRKKKMVLRYGETFFLQARNNDNKVCEDVLVIARYSMMETVIIATNLSENDSSFYIDSKAIIPTFKRAYTNNTVVMMKDLIHEKEEPRYFFLREFLELREMR